MHKIYISWCILRVLSKLSQNGDENEEKEKKNNCNRAKLACFAKCAIFKMFCFVGKQGKVTKSH